MRAISCMISMIALIISPAVAQNKPLTLSNLKGPIAKAAGKEEAKSIKELWSQIEGLPNVSPPPVDLRAALGVNVAGLAFYTGEQTFANQATVLEWRDPNGGWSYVPSDRLRNGVPISITPGRPLLAYLTPPAAAWQGKAPETRCTWSGTGTVAIGGGSVTGTVGRAITFRWPATKAPVQTVSVSIAVTDASDPIRDIDCREPGETGMFAAQLLDYFKPFGVLRFLDWSNANGNPAKVTWATRGQTGTNITGGTDGYALEYQINLSNAVNASPWFTVPLNADADYQQRMAQMVHDAVPAGRPVYVELSNETWNYQFGQANQLQTEGIAAKLSDNGFQAAQYRYAQRVIDMMAIWSKVYADRPRDLVRVMATQAGNSWVGDILVDWNSGALRNSIDAIAIAPYFSVDLAAGDDLIGKVSNAAQSQISNETVAYVAIGKRIGKRVIAYESGQHLVDPARVDTVKVVNRDPAMAGIYTKYRDGWYSATGGDLIVFYNATSPISGYGAWGLREYAGQPLSETPKLRGVLAR